MNIAVRKRKPEFILVFLAGLIILAQGITFFAGIFIGLPEDETLNTIRHGLGEDMFNMFLIRAGIAGVSTGSMLVLLSILIERNEDNRRWGAMVIVLSIISIMGIGFINVGMLPGIALAIIGGVLTLKRGKGSVFPGREYKHDTTSMDDMRVRETGIIYNCSICNVEFVNDEELKRHIVRFHPNEVLK